MKISHSTLVTVFDLLERERAVSYERLAEVLDVSRMTAYRTCQVLLEERKIKERHGTDPQTGRRMKLIAFPNAPQILMMDMQHDPFDMRAYYCDGVSLTGVSCAYHPAYGQENNTMLNTERLLEMATLVWPDAPLAHRIIWGEDLPRATGAHPSLTLCPKKEEALFYAITHHPDLVGKSSVLFLRMGPTPYGIYVERQSPAHPWHPPIGQHLITSLLRSSGWSARLCERERLAVTARLFNAIHNANLYRHPPEIIITEEDDADSTFPQPLRPHINISGRPAEIHRKKSAIPLYVYGALWQFRRELFLGEQTTE